MPPHRQLITIVNLPICTFVKFTVLENGALRNVVTRSNGFSSFIRALTARMEAGGKLATTAPLEMLLVGSGPG